MPDLRRQFKPLPAPNPVSLPFKEALDLPSTGQQIVNRRPPVRTPLNLKREPLKLILDRRGDAVPALSKPTGAALGRNTARRGVSTRVLAPVGRFAPVINNALLFYDLVDLAEQKAPHFQDWLRDGWRGSQPGEVTTIVEGMQCPLEYRFNVTATFEDGQTLLLGSDPSGTATNYGVVGPVDGLGIDENNRFGIFGRDFQGNPSFGVILGSADGLVSYQINASRTLRGEPDDCGDKIGTRVSETGPDRPGNETTDNPGPGSLPIPVVSLGTFPGLPGSVPNFGNDEIIEAEIIEEGGGQSLPPSEGNPPPSDTEEEDPIAPPVPGPTCSDPCLAPIQGQIQEVSEKIDVVDRVQELVEALQQQYAQDQLEQTVSDIQSRVRNLEELANCIDFLYCTEGQAFALLKSCSGEIVESYGQRVRGFDGLVDYLNKLDEFNQYRFNELCNEGATVADVEESLILQGTAQVGQQIFQTGLLTELISYISVKITDFWDNRNGTRVYKRDNSGLTNGSFGVISIGLEQSGDTYYLESQNMSFPTLLIPIPEKIRGKLRVKASMPSGTTFQIWDTGLRE